MRPIDADELLKQAIVFEDSLIHKRWVDEFIINRMPTLKVKPKTIEVSANTAVKILYDFFNLPYRDGYYIKRSESGVKGIYYTEDVSTHGSSDIKEFLYSDDEKKIEPFEHLVAIEKLIQEKNTEKVGHWIGDAIQGEIDGQVVKVFTCSECGAISLFRMTGGKIVNGDLCPNCGVKMQERKE